MWTLVRKASTTCTRSASDSEVMNIVMVIECANNYTTRRTKSRYEDVMGERSDDVADDAGDDDLASRYQSGDKRTSEGETAASARFGSRPPRRRGGTHQRAGEHYERLVRYRMSAP